MLNKVQLIGRLGKNPDVRYVEPDVAVARFSLATTEYYKSKEGEKKENTEWHNILVWRQLAKFSEQFLQKGMLIYVEGRLQTRKYLDQNQIERYSTEILAEVIRILEKKSDRSDAPLNNANNQNSLPNNKNTTEIQNIEIVNNNTTEDFIGIQNPAADDDLPF